MNRALHRAREDLKKDTFAMAKSAASLSPLGRVMSIYEAGQNADRLRRSLVKTGAVLQQQGTRAVHRQQKRLTRKTKKLLHWG